MNNKGVEGWRRWGPARGTETRFDGGEQRASTAADGEDRRQDPGAVTVERATTGTGSEHFLHDGDVDPAAELAGDLTFHAGELEAT